MKSTSEKEVYILTRRDKEIFRGTEDECYKTLHRVCSSSWQHAITHEGYRIRPRKGTA